jgi:hypothetical protein
LVRCIFLVVRQSTETSEDGYLRTCDLIASSTVEVGLVLL